MESRLSWRADLKQPCRTQLTPSLGAASQKLRLHLKLAWDTPGCSHIPMARTEADGGSGDRDEHQMPWTCLTQSEFGWVVLSWPLLSHLQTILVFVMMLTEVLLILAIFLPDIRTLSPRHCTLRENKIKTGHFLVLKVWEDSSELRS